MGKFTKNQMGACTRGLGSLFPLLNVAVGAVFEVVIFIVVVVFVVVVVVNQCFCCLSC